MKKLVLLALLLSSCIPTVFGRGGDKCNPPPEEFFGATSMGNCGKVGEELFCCGYEFDILDNYCNYVLCRASCQGQYGIVYGLCMDSEQHKEFDQRTQDRENGQQNL